MVYSLEPRLLKIKADQSQFQGIMAIMAQRTVLLYIEDNNDDAFMFERAIRPFQESVVYCRVIDGMEAQQYLRGEGKFADRQRFPLPHIIVSDLKMPRMNGFEFACWLRPQELFAKIPLIIFSSSWMSDDVSQAARVGAHRYFIKPVALDDWKCRVREMLDCCAAYPGERPVLPRAQ